MAFLHNLCVNLQNCLCGVLQYASAQFFDFLDLAQKFTFLNRKLLNAQFIIILSIHNPDKIIMNGANVDTQKPSDDRARGPAFQVSVANSWEKGDCSRWRQCNYILESSNGEACPYCS